MSMLLADLIADHKASLMDAAVKFTAPLDADFERHVLTAVRDFSRAVPHVKAATLTVTAGEHYYDAPDDLIAVKYSTWGADAKSRYSSWEIEYPRNLPTPRLVEQLDGRKIFLLPAPTTLQVQVCGAEYPYLYYALHVISDTPGLTTVPDDRRDVLLLRAAAEAMRELSSHGVAKPVQLGGSVSVSMPKNGTPAALYQMLLDEFRRQAV